MLPSSASEIEVARTTVALLGAGIATALLANVWLSYRAVVAWIGTGRVVRWGPRHTFVFGFLIGIGLLLLMWLGFLALGVNAILNPPPLSPERIDAATRGGWILIGLQVELLAFQGILLWAWLAVGRKTMHPGREEPVSLAELFRHATGTGRDLGHLVNNRLGVPVGNIDIVLETETLTDDGHDLLVVARDTLVALGKDADALHKEIKALEPRGS